MTTIFRSPRRFTVLAALAAVSVFGAACSDDGGGSTTSDTGAATTDAPDVEPLMVLVTNDDGFGAEGIDQLVEGLTALPDVEVTVYAPAENQSGTGSTTSPGPVPTFESETLSGYPVVAVEGTPADSVNTAFDAGVEPDVVVSGVNEGQNLGSIADEVSGTVGAARAAAQHGVPAVAVSQGLGEPPDYEIGAEEAVTWVEENRDELLAGDAAIEVVNINAPTCATGTVKEVIEVPLATEVPAEVFGPTDCTIEGPEPATDVEAFMTGYISLTVIGAE